MDYCMTLGGFYRGLVSMMASVSSSLRSRLLDTVSVSLSSKAIIIPLVMCIFTFYKLTTRTYNGARGAIFSRAFPFMSMRRRVWLSCVVIMSIPSRSLLTSTCFRVPSRMVVCRTK